MLKKALENILSEEESEELFSSFDQIGKIIVLRIPDSLKSKKKIIGETLLDQVKSTRSVFYQSSPVEGKSYRDGDELEADTVQEGSYEDFFKSALEKWGVSEPDQLDDEEKSKFFNYVDANWSGENETD